MLQNRFIAAFSYECIHWSTDDILKYQKYLISLIRKWSMTAFPGEGDGKLRPTSVYILRETLLDSIDIKMWKKGSEEQWFRNI